MKWKAMVIALVLLVAGSAHGMNIWALYDDGGLTTRLGFDVAENIEAGIEVAALTDWTDPFDADTDYLCGIFAAVELGDIGDGLVVPYVAGRLLCDLDHDDLPIMVGPALGVKIAKILTIEFRDPDWEYYSSDMAKHRPDDYLVSAGIKYRF